MCNFSFLYFLYLDLVSRLYWLHRINWQVFLFSLFSGRFDYIPLKKLYNICKTVLNSVFSLWKKNTTSV